MVYSSISIIYGIQLDTQLLAKILLHNENDYKGSVDTSAIGYRIKQIIKQNNKDFILVSQFCCRKIPRIILGYELSVYKRNIVKCGQNNVKYTSYPTCGQYFICNPCLGTTTNGVYDIIKLQQENIQCDSFCMHCKNDKCNNECQLVLTDKQIEEEQKTNKNILKEYDKQISSFIKGNLTQQHEYVQREINKTILFSLTDLIMDYYNKYSDLKCTFHYFVDDCTSCT